MFTGIIQDIGVINGVEHSSGATRMWVKTKLGADTFTLGESIAVDGVCLTVSEIKGDAFRVDVSAESMSRSTLKEAAPGRKVNLERAMQATDRFGGHFVLGHVDGIGNLKEVRREGEYLRMVITPPPELLRYIVEKGSVAVDGVSLTINSVDAAGFSLMLIPTTIAQTTLAQKRPGDKVNIETDIIGKYIEKFLAARSGGITLEKLREQGF